MEYFKWLKPPKDILYFNENNKPIPSEVFDIKLINDIILSFNSQFKIIDLFKCKEQFLNEIHDTYTHSGNSWSCCTHTLCFGLKETKYCLNIGLSSNGDMYKRLSEKHINTSWIVNEAFISEMNTLEEIHRDILKQINEDVALVLKYSFKGRIDICFATIDPYFEVLQISLEKGNPITIPSAFTINSKVENKRKL